MPSSTLNQPLAFSGVHVLRFYLPFSSATPPLSREDFIRALTVYEPTYSPGAGQLQINEALISTVAALMESLTSPGPTISGPLLIRLKVLTTRLASTRCLDLSVSCAVASSSNFSFAI
jgi:hypothetical protein